MWGSKLMVFSIESSLTNVSFSILIFLKKPNFILWRKMSLNFESKSSIIWAISVSFTCGAAQKKRFSSTLHLSLELFDWELDGRFWSGCYEEKHFEGQDFTRSIASFGRIGKSELEIKDRKIRLSNQVCLLKYKGFDWHSDGLNQNWVELEPTNFDQWDIIHNISTPWKF